MKKKYVKIVPNSDPENTPQGLGQYGEVMVPGARHTYYLAEIQLPGTSVVKYITGLDETHPSVTMLDDEEREEKIKKIRTEVADIMYALYYKKVDINDPDFWEKCKDLAPTNREFWSKLTITIDNKGLFLNLNNPFDRCKYNAIKAGGYYEIAPSLKIAKTNFERYLFYLDDVDTVSEVVIDTKAKAKAYSGLYALLSDSSPVSEYKMKYLTRILVSSNTSIIEGQMPKDVYFSALDKFLSSTGKTGKKAIEEFNSIYNMDIDLLAKGAFFQDLIRSGEITFLSDSKVYYIKEQGVRLENDFWTSVKMLSSPAYYQRYLSLVDNFAVNLGYSKEELAPEYKTKKVESSVTESMIGEEISVKARRK